MQIHPVSHDDTESTSTIATGGLFSHPTTDHLETKPASSPDGDQRTYTGLFREPAGAAEQQ